MNQNLNYDQQIYRDGPLTVKEMNDQKYDKIHNQLFEIANKLAYQSLVKDILDSLQNESKNDSTQEKDKANTRLKKLKRIYPLISSYDLFLSNVNIIEYKSYEYYEPSYVLWRTKSFPFITLSVNSSYQGTDNINFWCSQPTGKMPLHYWWNYYMISKIVHTEESDKYKGFEITYINYVSGEATLYNRLTNRTIKIPFSEISENMRISDDYSLENMISGKYSYGNNI